ncbi:MAG: hypothetical protein WEE03_02325 [Chloroflexota bacterium]
MTERSRGEVFIEHQALDIRAAGFIGGVSGLVGIACCVSPVILYLIGVASATTAVSLGNTLYYDYGWYFRGAGLAVGVLAVILYLRGRGRCDLRAARSSWLTLAGAGVVAVVTYAALYGATTWLGSLAQT